MSRAILAIEAIAQSIGIQAAPASKPPLPNQDEELDLLCTPQPCGDGINLEPVSEQIIARIQTILKYLDGRAGRGPTVAWWTRPRTYAILRRIGGLQFMQELTKMNWSDFYLPAHESTLPEFIRDEDQYHFRALFLANQDYFLSKSKDIESCTIKHYNIVDGNTIFHQIRPLGQGGFGSVDHVWSSQSYKRYARKRAFKGSNSDRSRMAQRAMVSELQALKKLDHQHLVKIIGSYTDTQYIAYIMTPVADFTLDRFLFQRTSLGEDHKQMLRRFFGCLANAVNYLHRHNVRHNDLSRRNILIWQGEVYISDFGSSHSWNSQAPMGSRTRHISTGVSPDYMAPEVAKPDATSPKGRAVDMWALGVLFVEITTRLLGYRLEEFRAAIQKSATRDGRAPPFLYANTQVIPAWMETLRRRNVGSPHDNEPLQWIGALLQKDPSRRPSSVQLMSLIHESPSFSEFCCFKCCSEYMDESYAYTGEDPKFDTEHESQALIDTVEEVFGRQEDGFYVAPQSEQTTSFIESWRATTSASARGMATEHGGEDLQFPGETLFNDTGPAFYDMWGMDAIPEAPAEPQEGKSQPLAFTFPLDWGSEQLSRGMSTAGDEHDVRIRSVEETEQRLMSSTLQFDEVESASSEDDMDDSRMFDEVNDRSDSSSILSDSPASCNLGWLATVEEEDDESSNEEGNGGAPVSGGEVAPQIKATTSPVPDSKTGAAPTYLHGNSTKPSHHRKLDSTSADNPIHLPSRVVDLGTRSSQANELAEKRKAEMKPVNRTDARVVGIQGVESITQARPVPSFGPLREKTLPGRGTKPPPALCRPASSVGQVAAPVLPDNTPKPAKFGDLKQLRAARRPKKNMILQPSDGIRVFPSDKVGESQTPTLKIAAIASASQPKPRRTAALAFSRAGSEPVPSAAPKQLSKDNLRKLTTRGPEKTVELLNPAEFLKKTWEDASSIATSAMSENTKRLFMNLTLPVKAVRERQDAVAFAIENEKFHGYEKLVWLLVENGARTDDKDKVDETPLMKLFSGSGAQPLEKHKLQALAILLQANADVNCVLPGTGNTPLHMAVRAIDAWSTAMLLHKGAKVTAQDSSGTTPLLITANQFHGKLTNEHATVLNVVLKFIVGEDRTQINVKAGVSRRSALHRAVVSGTAQAVDLLLKYGASTSATDKAGLDPIQYAIKDATKLTSDERRLEDHAEIIEGLNAAAKGNWPVNQKACVLQLDCTVACHDKTLKDLLARGLNANTEYRGTPLLLLALQKRNERGAKRLVRAGAYVDSTSKENTGRADTPSAPLVTAIDIAISQGMHDLARFMASEGKFANPVQADIPKLR